MNANFETRAMYLHVDPADTVDGKRPKIEFLRTATVCNFLHAQAWFKKISYSRCAWFRPYGCLSPLPGETKKCSLEHRLHSIGRHRMCANTALVSRK